MDIPISEIEFNFYEKYGIMDIVYKGYSNELFGIDALLYLLMLERNNMRYNLVINSKINNE